MNKGRYPLDNRFSCLTHVANKDAEAAAERVGIALWTML